MNTQIQGPRRHWDSVPSQAIHDKPAVRLDPPNPEKTMPRLGIRPVLDRDGRTRAG